MASRRLSDWLSAYLEYTENTEPPESYHLWVGISSIAAVLQRRVYIEWNFQTIYPNMFIVLVGPSGRCRKGTAMGLGRSLLERTKIALTAESTTRESLIQKMIRSETSYMDPSKGGELRYHCSLTCMSDELSVFLGQNDTKFLANLTDWYDSKDVWTYETKHGGEEVIRGLCFNMLGATAPDWLQSILPEEAIGGGFTSRIIFVVEEDKRKTVPIHIPTQQEIKLRQYLIEDLLHMSKIKGHFELTEEAEDLYVEWYESQDIETKRGKPPVSDPKFAGYCDRRATHIKKLCMVIAASRGNNMVIDASDFDRALKIMEASEVKMPKVFSSLGASEYAAITEKVLRFIEYYGTVPRSVILQNMYRDLDVPTLEIIIDKLEKMKALKREIDPAKGEEFYHWKGIPKRPE